MAKTKITKKRQPKTGTVVSGKVKKHRSVRRQSTASLSSDSDVAKTRKRPAKRRHPEEPKKGRSKKRLMTSSESETSPKVAVKAKKKSKPKQDETEGHFPATEYKKRKISAAAMKKWKPLSTETKAMMWNILDGAVTSVLSSKKPGQRGYNEIQDHLNNLRNGIYAHLCTIKVPAKKVDYGALHAKQRMIQEDLKMKEEQLHIMETEIERLKKVVSEKEEKVDRLKDEVEKPTEMAPHPILDNLPALVLNLPPLSSAVIVTG